MRKKFIETLTELSKDDPKIILIVGDVGFSFLEPYRERFPKQFLNIGIMEQTMMNVAAGLARKGYKPYVYTMSNFILTRPNEQLRNSICFSNANVKLFGVKGSAAYKFLGYSHNLYDTEEADYLKNLANINWYIPETSDEVRENMLYEYGRQGPSYMRI